jgi:Zn-dependent M16 (insulinase) family peptidase
MYLHREIREKGGAYGGFAIYNPEDGLFCFGSYRDPHIVTTLNVYRNAADFVRTNIFSDEDIKEAILQVCSEIDKPDPPGPTAPPEKHFTARSYPCLTKCAINLKVGFWSLPVSMSKQRLKNISIHTLKIIA